MRHFHQTFNKKIWSLPASITNVRMWIDADNEKSYSMTGLEVVRVNDRSTLAYQFYQSSSIARPKIVYRYGRKFLRFPLGENTNIPATSTSDQFNFLHNRTNHTIFIVCGTLANGTGAANNILGNTSGSQLQVGFGINHIDSTDTLQFAANKGTAGTSVWNKTGVAFPTTQINYLFQTYDSSTNMLGTAVNTTTLTNTAVSVTASTANAFKDLTLGEINGLRGMDYGDIVICDALLTLSQRNDLINEYALKKYGSLPFS